MFKGAQLCVPNYSLRDNLIRKNHSGNLAGHFGLDRTLEQLRRHYFWPKMQRDVRSFVEKCVICQKAKGQSTNAGLY